MFDENNMIKKEVIEKVGPGMKYLFEDFNKKQEAIEQEAKECAKMRFICCVLWLICFGFICAYSFRLS